MVVAPPAGALRQIELQNLIDDGNGIANERSMGVTNAKADQLEKIRADDVAGGVHAAAIGDLNQGRVRIRHYLGPRRVSRIDPDIMPWLAWDQLAAVRHQPFLEVRRKPV